jgi:enoyl-CoA hydratase/carnithine racemase
MTQDAKDFVLFETRAAAGGAQIGIATLNRPKTMNALNLPMFEMMLKQFRIWASDESVIMVVLQGAGEKGFCAGGDVAEVVRHVRAGGPQRFAYGDQFFTVEYELDFLLHTFPKPLITWTHGVTMGGGLGLSVTGSHRVMSTGMRVAMPEIHIGLFPDVGGGWFLSRLPGGAGTLMALTGIIISEVDAVFAGLADYIIPLDQRAAVTDQLCAYSWGPTAVDRRNQLTHLLRELAAAFALSQKDAPAKPSILQKHYDEIRDLTGRAKVTGIVRGLKELAQREPVFMTAAQSLALGSPTAALVTFEYLKRAELMSLREVLALDLVLAKQFARRADFPEGVRALLIDKDRTPIWEPKTFEAVSADLVAAHFAPI